MQRAEQRPFAANPGVGGVCAGLLAPATISPAHLKTDTETQRAKQGVFFFDLQQRRILRFERWDFNRCSFFPDSACPPVLARPCLLLHHSAVGSSSFVTQVYYTVMSTNEFVLLSCSQARRNLPLLNFSTLWVWGKRRSVGHLCPTRAVSSQTGSMQKMHWLLLKGCEIQRMATQMMPHCAGSVLVLCFGTVGTAAFFLKRDLPL